MTYTHHSENICKFKKPNMNNSNLSDIELWNKVVSDDSGAFALLYERHWASLFKTAEYYAKDPNLAEEIVHDVFVVLWQRRKHLNINNFKSYIFITTRYHVLRQIKAGKISPITYVENYQESSNIQVSDKVTEKISQSDFEIELNSLLTGLPKRCVEIFYLSRVNQLSNQEIANTFGITKPSVENQITHALKYIRNKLVHKPPS
jgi:RNA polymerase sigma-70 factor (family 1)